MSDPAEPEAATGQTTAAGRGTIGLLNGPNLAALGQRQPEVYGTSTLEDCVGLARAAAVEAGYGLDHLQTEHEGGLVAAVHQARGATVGLVVNAGALTHYGWSLHDALAAYDAPVVELHLSNPHAREQWRHTSVIAPLAAGIVSGFGAEGYRLATVGLISLLDR